MNENHLVNLFLGAASKALPNVRLFKRTIVSVEIKPGVHVRSNQVGQADLWGVERSTGRHFELEAKMHRGRYSEEQKRWKSWCEDWGILYRELKAQRGETSEETVARWISELEEALSK